MAAELPADRATWATDPGTTFEPSLSEKQAGWALNEKPPARWQNWWQNNVHENMLAIVNAITQTMVFRGNWNPTGLNTNDLEAMGGYLTGTGLFYAMFRDAGGVRWGSSRAGIDWNAIAIGGGLTFTAILDQRAIASGGDDGFGPIIVIARGNQPAARTDEFGSIFAAATTAINFLEAYGTGDGAGKAFIAKASGNVNFFRSIDQGDNWTDTGITSSAGYRKVAANGNRIVMIESATNVAVSTDNGAIWNSSAHGVSASVANIIYIASIDRFLITSNTAGVVTYWISDDNTGTSYTAVPGGTYSVGSIGSEEGLYDVAGRIYSVWQGAVFMTDYTFQETRNVFVNGAGNIESSAVTPYGMFFNSDDAATIDRAKIFSTMFFGDMSAS